MSRNNLDLVDAKAGRNWVVCLSVCLSVWVGPREGICDLMTRARRPEGGGREGGEGRARRTISPTLGVVSKGVVHGVVSSYVVSQAKKGMNVAVVLRTPSLPPELPLPTLPPYATCKALLPQLYFTLGLGSGPESLIRRREARTWTR